MTLDGALAFAMLAVSVVLVASVGLSHARSLQYGPIDEMAHVGYVEHIAETGLPPTGERQRSSPVRRATCGASDTVAPARRPRRLPAGVRETAARLPTRSSSSSLRSTTTRLRRSRSRSVSDHEGLLAAACSVSASCSPRSCLAFLAVRETAPERPLAAGLAAVILGTMSGLTYTLSQVQNDALLMGMYALVFWLLCRELPRRRAGYWLAGALGLLGVTQIVAIPFAAVALLGHAGAH